MENNNPSPTPEDVPESTGTSSSWSTSLATTSVARDATRGTGDGRGSRASTSSQPATSLMTYFLLLLRDLLTFFVRGGLSAMMFAMDQVLRVLSLVADVFLGPTASSVLSYPSRVAMWLYQVSLWVAYTMLELLFYLPWQVLIVYIIVLIVLLLVMPSPVTNIFKQLFTALHRFIGFYKTVYHMIRD